MGAPEVEGDDVLRTGRLLLALGCLFSVGALGRSSAQTTLQSSAQIIVPAIGQKSDETIAQSSGQASGQGSSKVIAAGMLPEAPSAVRRFEVGGQFTDMQFATCYQGVGCSSAPQFALGPGVSWNLNRHLAVDATYTVLLGYAAKTTNTPYIGGRGSVALAGVRAEARAARYGLFASVRPGVVHWTAVPAGARIEPGTKQVEFLTAGQTWFATEFAGGAEVDLGPRLRLRASLGDLLVDRTTPCMGCGLSSTSWANNLTTSVGLYAGVGKRLVEGARASEAEPHRFFGGTNLAVIGISLLAQTADAVTTQRFLSHGYQEANPLARPLVDHGWGGQVGLAVLVNAAEIGVMAGLHKMGHHRIERALPLTFAAVSAMEAKHNLESAGK